MEENKDDLTTLELLAKVREVVQKMEKLVTDREDEARLFNIFNSKTREKGPDSDTPTFHALEDFHSYFDFMEQKALDLEKMNLFIAKYAHVKKDRFSEEELVSYLEDTKWMKPVITRLYGEDSKEYHRMMSVLALEEDLLSKEEEE